MENNNECPSMKESMNESMNGGKRNILGLCEQSDSEIASVWQLFEVIKYTAQFLSRDDFAP